MDEMRLLRDLGTDLDEPGATTPAELRVRVSNGLAAAAGESERPRRWYLHRGGWQMAVAGALATVLLGAGMVAAGHLAGRVGPVAAAGEDQEATQVLHQAAQMSMTRSEPTPVAGQFTFVESIYHYPMAVQHPDGSFETRDSGPQLTQVWQSVDGTEPGLMRTRPASEPAAAPEESPLDAGSQGYLSGVPTDPASMLAYLYAHSEGDNPADQQAFQTAADMLRGAYLTPAQQAAVFRALAKIPGVTLLPNATDVAGRNGVAVAMAPAPAEAVIFDRATATYLGTRDSARLREAVVDHPGQLPPVD